jgi:hypothetical protein
MTDQVYIAVAILTRFGNCSVQISAGIPSILTKALHGCPQDIKDMP